MSEGSLQALFEQSDACLATLQVGPGEGLRVERLNPALAQRLGCVPVTGASREATDLGWSPTEVAEWRALLGRCPEERSLSFEGRLPRTGPLDRFRVTLSPLTPADPRGPAADAGGGRFVALVALPLEAASAPEAAPDGGPPERDRELQAAQLLLRSVVDSSSEMMAVFDPQGRYLAFNRAYRDEIEALVGIRIRLGMRLADVLASQPEDQAKSLELLSRALEGDEFTTVLSFGDPSRRRKVFELTGSRIVDEQQVPLGACAIIRDVTDRVRAEEELEQRVDERTAELSSLLEHAPVGLAFFDREARYARVNQVLADMNGMPMEAHVGVRVADLLPAVASQTLPSIEQVFVSGQPVESLEVSGRTPRTPERERVWLVDLFPVRDPGGAVRLVGAVVTDVTERKAAERDLLEREAGFRRLANTLPQLAWTADAEGVVDYYNERHREFRGFSRGDDGTWTWRPVLHPEDVARTARAWAEAVRTGADYEIEHRVQRTGGEFRWYLSRATPLRDDAGQVVRWYGTATDIEAQKRAEARLRKADRRKDEFLGMLGHELRNPLAALMSGLEVWRRMAPADDARLARVRETMVRQAQQLRRLIDDLLDVTRVTRGKVTLERKPLDLRRVTEAAVVGAREQLAARHQRLVVECDPEPLPVLGDALRLEQAVANLLSNASKYTPEGGRIEVRAVRASDRADAALVAVRDTGIGLSPEDAENAFDMFWQRDTSSVRSQGGLGLGLPLVRTLVELHGGRVEVHSEGPGQGSEFVVRLPLSREPHPEDAAPAEAPSAAAEPPPKAGSASPGRVLVVDDNQDLARNIQFLLQEAGYTSLLAHDGPRALELTRRFHPDVILLDLGLPELDGYEVARTLRQSPEFEHLGIVAISGYGLPADRARTRAAGFDAHVTKPVDPPALVSLIERVRRKANTRPAPDAPPPR